MYFCAKQKIMSTTELRKEIHQYIDKADDVFLEMVFAMSRVYKSEQTVGYDSDGKPITKENLKLRVKAASHRVKAGDFISQETIEKEIEDWQ